jgi:hypothetical protein
MNPSKCERGAVAGPIGEESVMMQLEILQGRNIIRLRKEKGRGIEGVRGKNK